MHLQDWNEGDYRVCIVKHINRFCNANFFLPIYTPNMNYSINNISFGAEGELFCLGNPELVKAGLSKFKLTELCPRPCEEHIYDASVFSLGEANGECIVRWQIIVWHTGLGDC